MTTATTMLAESPTDLHELIIDCPVCFGAGWMQAVEPPNCGVEGCGCSAFTIVCPMCLGRSWVPAVAEEVAR